MNNFESELGAYLKGYIDGIIEKRLSAIEERITALEHKDIPQIKPTYLRKDFMTAICELAYKDSSKSADSEEVHLLLKSMNYTDEEILEMEHRLCGSAHILKGKNGRLRIIDPAHAINHS